MWSFGGVAHVGTMCVPSLKAEFIWLILCGEAKLVGGIRVTSALSPNCQFSVHRSNFWTHVISPGS